MILMFPVSRRLLGGNKWKTLSPQFHSLSPQVCFHNSRKFATGDLFLKKTARSEPWLAVVRWSALWGQLLLISSFVPQIFPRRPAETKELSDERAR